jgi:pimeloyl-ACP methyl ester carboxylesterase
MSENSKCRRAGFRPALIVPLLALVGLACAGSRTEEIAEQYGYGEPKVTLEPFVIVPGFLGSSLVDKPTGHEVWGLFLAGEQRIWRPDVQQRVALPMTGGDTLAEMRDEVEPTEVMMNAHVEVAGKRFTVNAYPGILWAILSGVGDPAAQGGRSPSKGDLRAGARAEELAPTPGIHPVAYDWRRDISESAAALGGAIDAAYQEKLASGLRGEAARVDILAHSMGTLVTRYYLRYGTQPLPDDGSLPVLDWRGAERVRRVLLTAPPINGSLEALRDVTRGGTPQPPIPSHPAAVLASFASLYQMMPHPGSGAVVYADDASPVDFYDLQTWDRYGWG